MMAWLAVLLAAELNAQALVQRVWANRPEKDFSLKGRLYLTRERAVPVEILVKNLPGETRTIYRSGTNEVMIVQPVQGAVRYHLRGAKPTERFLGSEFTYYDLGLSFLQWPDVKWLGEERIRGRDCHVVEAGSRDGPYRRVKMWIDIEYSGLLRAEAFDEHGQLRKRFAVSSFKRVGEAWVPRAMEIATVPAGQALPAQEKSRLEVLEGDYDARLPAEWFSEAAFGPAS
jgi:hypothetical protein